MHKFGYAVIGVICLAGAYALAAVLALVLAPWWIRSIMRKDYKPDLPPGSLGEREKMVRERRF